MIIGIMNLFEHFTSYKNKFRDYFYGETAENIKFLSEFKSIGSLLSTHPEIDFNEVSIERCKIQGHPFYVDILTTENNKRRFIYDYEEDFYNNDFDDDEITSDTVNKEALFEVNEQGIYEDDKYIFDFDGKQKIYYKDNPEEEVEFEIVDEQASNLIREKEIAKRQLEKHSEKLKAMGFTEEKIMELFGVDLKIKKQIEKRRSKYANKQIEENSDRPQKEKRLEELMSEDDKYDEMIEQAEELLLTDVARDDEAEEK